MAISNAIVHRIPAGWYPDRFDRSRRRWWDGTEWTDYYSAVPASRLRLVENETDAIDIDETTTPHTLSGALHFSDRLPAFILLGLVVANIIVVVILTRI
ncbi:MAG: hypothetical protein JWR36_1617 [Glaciihabitans sp.]|jgi:hypothetical protein|nr:hypothetical protein [Glaciihabitans sp.]MDQ1570504.1 hypothetical protein [Actinomycetota bacterium]